MPEYSVHPLELKMHERRQKNIHLSHIEVLEAVRTALIAELDLISLYEQVLNITRDDTVKKVFGDIVKERQQIVGVLIAVMARLDPGFARRFREGIEKFRKDLGVQVEI